MLVYQPPRFILKVKVCFDGDNYNVNINDGRLVCFFMDEKPVALSVGGSLFTSSFTNSNGYAQVSRVISARLISVNGKAFKASFTSTPSCTPEHAKLYSYTFYCLYNKDKVKTSPTAKDIHKELEFCSIFENMQTPPPLN